MVFRKRTNNISTIKGGGVRSDWLDISNDAYEMIKAAVMDVEHAVVK